MIPDSLLAVWFSFVFIAEPIERASHHRLVARSEAVQDGMTPIQVKAILGDPDAEYAKRGVFATWWLEGPRPKQWMYGTFFNLDYLVIPKCPWLNPVPVNVRIFDYADDDLVINWTANDRVSAVKRSNFDVPEVAFAMLDAAVFSRDVLRLFVFPPPPKPVNGG